MKLYKELSELQFDNVKPSEVAPLLDKYGLLKEFNWCKSHKNFKEFVFWFVNCFSFDSALMNTDSFSSSVELISKVFGFDINSFRCTFQKEDNFDLNYEKLLSTYLKVQQDNEYESLLFGRLLYDQMVNASISMSIIYKVKDGNDMIENIDYNEKFKIYMNSLELKKELQAIETKLSKALGVVEGAIENNQSLLKSSEPVRIEEMVIKSNKV